MADAQLFHTNTKPDSLSKSVGLNQCRESKPVSRVLSSLIIYLGLSSPTASNGLPTGTAPKRYERAARVAEATFRPIWPFNP